MKHKVSYSFLLVGVLVMGCYSKIRAEAAEILATMPDEAWEAEDRMTTYTPHIHQLAVKMLDSGDRLGFQFTGADDVAKFREVLGDSADEFNGWPLVDRVTTHRGLQAYAMAGIAGGV